MFRIDIFWESEITPQVDSSNSQDHDDSENYLLGFNSTFDFFLWSSKVSTARSFCRRCRLRRNRIASINKTTFDFMPRWLDGISGYFFSSVFLQLVSNNDGDVFDIFCCCFLTYPESHNSQKAFVRDSSSILCLFCTQHIFFPINGRSSRKKFPFQFFIFLSPPLRLLNMMLMMMGEVQASLFRSLETWNAFDCWCAEQRDIRRGGLSLVTDKLNKQSSRVGWWKAIQCSRVWCRGWKKFVISIY